MLIESDRFRYVCEQDEQMMLDGLELTLCYWIKYNMIYDMMIFNLDFV